MFWWLAALLLLPSAPAAAAVAIHRALRPIRSPDRPPGGLSRAADWQPWRRPGEFGGCGRRCGPGRRGDWLAAELTAYRDRLQSVLDSMGAGVVVSSSDGRVELINPAARELLGIDGSAAALPVPVNGSGPNGQAFQASNGRVINAVSTPIRQSGGDSLASSPSWRTSRRERELERVRSDFLTVVSHELRTPLTAVKGSLDLLLDGDAGTLDPLQQRFLHTARRNAERLITLVNDLLDLSRLEAGQVQLTLHPADIRRIVDDVVIGLGTIFDRKGQADPISSCRRSRCSSWPTAGASSRSSRTCWATPPTTRRKQGEISVVAQRRSCAGQAVLTVRNTGPGIAPEDREHLFEKFYRGGNA